MRSRSRCAGPSARPQAAERRRQPAARYALDEGDGRVGTVCVYEATGPEAIRKHARCADLPADEIIALADTVIVRPDPAGPPPVAAHAG